MTESLEKSTDPGTERVRRKRDRDEVFVEFTRSICPVCKVVIDAQVNIRDDKVYLRKRCAEHGEFEALVYGDARMYVDSARFNKPGTIPLTFQTEVKDGCPATAGCARNTSSTPAWGRGQHRLQPRLPDLLRRLRPPTRRVLDHPRAVCADAGRVRGQ